MKGTSRRTLGSREQHTHTHSLEDHTQSIQKSTSNHTKQRNNNHTQPYCELFHQTIHKHATHKINRSINRATHKIQGYNTTLTPTQVQDAIKQSKITTHKVRQTKHQALKTHMLSWTRIPHWHVKNCS